mmetsp:Transcript_20197/g.20994  ORF Transcript_20197/g.20994 Transcript_20197/m.20994 type:complete len:148 (-) Transcript_20197:69-512(-)
MSLIDSIIEKIVHISTLELTDKELFTINSNKTNREFLAVLDDCKMKNEGNSYLNLLQKKEDNAINDTKDISDTNENTPETQKQFNMPQFFICCSSQICSVELESFRRCQTQNKKNLSKCQPQLQRLESCISKRICYFYDHLHSIKEL